MTAAENDNRCPHAHTSGAAQRAHHEAAALPAGLPPRLAARPVDARRGLPIPYVNEDDDGNADFAMIQGDRSLRCATRNLCGLCGHPNEYWISFIGGPGGFRERTYTDPPGHVDCMRAALTLCPYLAVERYRRRQDIGMVATDEALFTAMEKSDPVILAITRGYRTCLLGDVADPRLLFLPHPWTSAFRFTYTDGHLTEDGPEPLT